jgi:hypothetical protein
MATHEPVDIIQLQIESLLTVIERCLDQLHNIPDMNPTRQQYLIDVAKTRAAEFMAMRARGSRKSDKELVTLNRVCQLLTEVIEKEKEPPPAPP